MISAIKVWVVTKRHKIFEALANAIKYGCIKKNCQRNEACSVEKWLPFPFLNPFLWLEVWSKLLELTL